MMQYFGTISVDFVTLDAVSINVPVARTLFSTKEHVLPWEGRRGVLSYRRTSSSRSRFDFIRRLVNANIHKMLRSKSYA